MVSMQKLQLFLILLSVFSSILIYPSLPEDLASHWGENGQVNGYLPKFWGVALIPFIMIIFTVLMYYLPSFDPLKNISKFKRDYEIFVVVILAFFFLIHLQVLLWNIGIQISPNLIIPIAIGMLFLYIGYLLPKTKRNWFIGIRTPWTMSSDIVWEKTHAIASKLFFIVGIIAFFASIFQDFLLILIIVPIILAALITVVISYLEFKKINL